MLKYFKRAGDPGGKSGTAPKRPRPEEAGSSAGSPGPETSDPSAGGDPRTIVTWNANGLGVRLSKDWQELKEFLVTVMPDVCCIQEVNTEVAVGRMERGGEGKGVVSRNGIGRRSCAAPPAPPPQRVTSPLEQRGFTAGGFLV